MPRLSQLYGRRLEARKQQVDKNLKDMAALLDRTQKDVLGTLYPPASRPGEAPRKRTGRLQRESTVKVNPNSVEFVAPTPYAKYLKPTRPWQDIVFAKARAALIRIERQGMPFGESN